jgi:hypothetical protein
MVPGLEVPVTICILTLTMRIVVFSNSYTNCIWRGGRTEI